MFNERRERILKSMVTAAFIMVMRLYSFADMDSNNTYQNHFNMVTHKVKFTEYNTIDYLNVNGLSMSKPYSYTAGLFAVEFYTLILLNDHDSDPSFKNFKNAYKDIPRPDDDSITYNFILHPIMGSETYLRARIGGFGIAGSIAFSYGASFAWEYLVESFTEHPSLQDLIFTTGIGWVLGELRYALLNYSSGKEFAWLLDPISFLAEHFHVSVTIAQVDGEYEKRARGMLSWNF